MWYAVAVWFLMAPPVVMPITQVPFHSKAECIEYVIEHSEFNIKVHEVPSSVWLDDGVEDRFAVACMTRTKET